MEEDIKEHKFEKTRHDSCIFCTMPMIHPNHAKYGNFSVLVRDIKIVHGGREFYFYTIGAARKAGFQL